MPGRVAGRQSWGQAAVRWALGCAWATRPPRKTSLWQGGWVCARLTDWGPWPAQPWGPSPVGSRGFAQAVQVVQVVVSGQELVAGGTDGGCLEGPADHPWKTGRLFP